MKILVIDGQGGNLGRQLIKRLIERLPEAELFAVGTNSIATSNMIKAGATNAATGENAVIVGCRRADAIVGPLGIVIADALSGEITPAMATAVGQSEAVRVLLPMNRCNTLVAGAINSQTAAIIEDAVSKIAALQ